MYDTIEMGKRIKAARLNKGYTQEELGALLYLNKSTIQRYEAGKIASPKLPVVHAMAVSLDVNPAYLALKTDDPEPKEITVPIPDGKLPIDILAKIARILKSDYCFSINENSMENSYLINGDAVFVYDQPEVKNGEIYAVEINGQKMLRRVYKQGENNYLLLADNDEQNDMLNITDDEIESGRARILGKAVYMFRII